MKDGRCLFWDLLDTDGDTLDTGYYDTESTDAVLTIQKDGLQIASITVDNEASPHAGIRQAITEGSLRWLIHFRWGCHTLALLMEGTPQLH